MIKKEQQLNLSGQEIINQPKLGHIKREFPYSAVRVLREFYFDFSNEGLSLVELKKKLRIEISKNTIATALEELKNANMIMITVKNVGPTKRRKYYKITEKGAVFWEQINKR